MSMKRGGNKELDPRAQKFIEVYLESGNASRSALAAGYTDTREGYRLLQRPAIRAEVEAHREHSRLEAQFGLKEATAEVNRHIERAESEGAKGISAIPRLLELKFKLYGLLKEKIDLTVETVDMRAALEAAEARSGLDIETRYKVLSEEYEIHMQQKKELEQVESVDDPNGYLE